MSAPSRPRPRPRPKAKPSGSSESTPTTSIAVAPVETTSRTIITINKETLTASSKTVAVPSAPVGAPEQAVIEVPDDDDFDIFARRRNTTRDNRAGTEERTNRAVGISLSSSETDYSDEVGHGQKKRKRNKVALTRSWSGYGGTEGKINEDEDGIPNGRRNAGARSPPAGKRDRQTTRSASRARSISLTPPPQIAPIIPIPTYRPMHAVHALLDDDDLGYEWKPTSTGVELGSKEDANDDLAALIAKARAKHAADAHTGPAANPTGLRGASSVSAGGADNGTGHFADRGIMLQLTITMRQDPVRAKVISERALKVYEKPRVFTIGSKCSLDPIYEKLAEVLDKEKEDIILTYNGERIWSTNFTPERLKIYTDEKLEGYEKDAWERTQQWNESERQRKLREAELELAERHARAGEQHQEVEDDEIEVTAAHVARPTADGRGASGPAQTGKNTAADNDDDDDSAQAEDTSTILTLTLRGKEGDVKAKAKPTTKMSGLVAYYRKTKKVEGEMEIELDGEILEGDSTIADADLDDGDMLSVVPAR